ncbi:Branched-chain amino acid transport protein (AzlD) [Pseudodesulfovibrio hydrargyri]|uniref:Branched-chain amino acid transport protein (AzlD) n=1 Tax=Pseudodesulfovibrio hydrargyri TaxID=2125990 RepID=A0A1J5N6C3_9BACT|nr:AzlD domain-containing protein [Pseudodesulfovibrio hydrargyri]OIQ50376.1 Branched-chain amino acid transport protein (AzlD) [Pseudodesulfovibrio hydrargyri]
MTDTAGFWVVGALLGLGTFLIRFSFILIVDKVTFPEAVIRMLRFIPASVLPAIIVPAVLLHGTDGGPVSLARPVAALVAVLAAWKTRSILATILSGMGTLWLLRAVL